MRAPLRTISFLTLTLAAGSLSGCVLSPVGAAGRAQAANRVEAEARSDADTSVNRLLLSHRRDAVTPFSRVKS